MTQSIAGVVLVGGQSSRMGQNKALLNYQGRPLYQHMQGLLRAAGMQHVYLSGSLPEEDCIADHQSYAGPACAVAGVMDYLADQHTHALIVPVDMPLLTAELLRALSTQANACRYEGQIFPLFLPVQRVAENMNSMKQLIDFFEASTCPLPANSAQQFSNFNTPDDWQRLS